MRVFFDTNVLVYLFDADATEKKLRAQALIQETASNQTAVLSTQVLQEFFVVTTRKLAIPLSIDDAEQAIRHLSILSVVNVDVALILAAIQTSKNYQFSFWDALIIKAAQQGGAEILYTEDLQHEQVIGNLQVINPFFS